MLHQVVGSQSRLQGWTVNQMMASYNQFHASDDPVVRAAMDQIARQAFYGVWDLHYQQKVQAELQAQARLQRLSEYRKDYFHVSFADAQAQGSDIPSLANTGWLTVVHHNTFLWGGNVNTYEGTPGGPSVALPTIGWTDYYRDNSWRETGLSGWQFGAAQLLTLWSKNGTGGGWNDVDMRSREVGALNFAVEHGGTPYMQGPICGTYAVCYTSLDVLPYRADSKGADGLTIGRVILTTETRMDPYFQFHEFGHVIQWIEEGDTFFGAYYMEGFRSWFDDHIGNCEGRLCNDFEADAVDRSNLASELYKKWVRKFSFSPGTQPYLLPPSITDVYAPPDGWEMNQFEEDSPGTLPSGGGW